MPDHVPCRALRWGTATAIPRGIRERPTPMFLAGTTRMLNATALAVRYICRPTFFITNTLDDWASLGHVQNLHRVTEVQGRGTRHVHLALFIRQ